MVKNRPQAEDCRWIFGYGSLMWNPGFKFERQTQARLTGYHRRLSVYSNHYRGTEEKPGLVLGLDRGGSCVGLGFEISHAQWRETLDYVRGRELITQVYREIIMPIYFDYQHEPVWAVTYAVDRTHPQCAPPMSVEKTMEYIIQGQGQSGTCLDYVRNTLMHLRGMGLRDTGLEKLAPVLQALSSAHP